MIPFFNAASTLERALDSVRKQSIQVREIVVVDDGSSPIESARAASIVNDVPRARIIHLESNVGPGEARNVAWDLAEGEWIAFLDSDDAWHPQKLEMQLAVLGAVSPTPVLFASGAVESKQFGDHVALNVQTQPKFRVVRLSELLLHNVIATSSVLVRRDIAARFPAGRRYCEDYELWLAIVSGESSVVRLEAPLVMRFQPPVGASGLSGSIWRMIVGEYRAFLGAFRGGSLSHRSLTVGLALVTARSAIRVCRLLVRVAHERLPSAVRSAWKVGSRSGRTYRMRGNMNRGMPDSLEGS